MDSNRLAPLSFAASSSAPYHNLRKWTADWTLTGHDRRPPHSPGVYPLWRLIAGRSGRGRPGGLLVAWTLWERCANRIWPSRSIPGAPFGLLRFRPMRYCGNPLLLPDGALIVPGDLVGELHCNNTALATLIEFREISRLRACRADLNSLGRWLGQSGELPTLKAFYGVTLLWWAAARLGFNVRERQAPLRNWFDWIFMGGLLLIYAADGATRAKLGTTLSRTPREVWISRKELSRGYADSVR